MQLIVMEHVLSQLAQPGRGIDTLDLCSIHRGDHGIFYDLC